MECRHGPAHPRTQLAWREAGVPERCFVSFDAGTFLQKGFPGIGNWMADEILWRAKLDPRRQIGELPSEALHTLLRAIRFVSRGALQHVSPAFADPPKGWLFHERWKPGGVCPIHGIS